MDADDGKATEIPADAPAEISTPERMSTETTLKPRSADRHRKTPERKEYQRDYLREYMRKRRQSHNGELKRFVGVDGEGGAGPDGRHNYFLLRAGGQYLLPRHDDVRLTSYACLDFLSTLDPSNIYVAFFFDYDVTKILEDLSSYKLTRLLDRESRRGRQGYTFPVDWMDFQFDYMPKKWFKVRKEIDYEVVNGRRKPIWGPWITISDVGTFFQCRFVRALDLWEIGTKEELAEVLSGKMSRGVFTFDDIDEVIPYNALEVKLLAELMEAFREACIQAGYIPNTWTGPGQLAEAAFKKHHVPKSRDVPILNDPDYAELMRFGQSAFYGGRMEISIVGQISAPVFQYDLNSAYPDAMRYLPCLLHGKWTRHTTGGLPTASFTERSGYALVYGRFGPNPGKQPLYYGLPVRGRHGSIHFPAAGGGWYWNFEIAASKHQDFRPLIWWVYERQCDCRPLAYVEGLYEERLKLGKDARGLILKLMLNSHYGKMAQSIGSPQYSNPIYASFITAYTRARVQDFVHESPNCAAGKCGHDVAMIATDSVASLWDRRVDDGKRLGGWSPELHPTGMFIVMSGVYFGTSGKSAKTRGVPLEAITVKRREFEQAFRRMAEAGDFTGGVRVPQRMFCGIRYSLQRKDFRLLGQWIELMQGGESGKLVSFNWRTKRRGDLFGKSDGYVVTLPYDGDENVETIPYSKDIGNIIKNGLPEEYAISIGLDETPDWAGGEYRDLQIAMDED